MSASGMGEKAVSTLGVMIVEDESIIRKGLEKAIARMDGSFRVVGAFDDGESALAFLERTDAWPDLIVTDIYMRRMDGLELIEAARKLRPDVKCVILSGHEDFQLAKKAIALKVERYVLKPIDAAELGKVLAEAAEDIRRERSIRSDQARLETLESLHAMSAAHLRDKLVADLLRDRPASLEDARRFSHVLPFGADDRFVCGVMRVRKGCPAASPRDAYLYCMAVRQLFTETVLAETGGFAVETEAGALAFGVVCAGAAEDAAREAVERFAATSEAVLRVPVAVAIGGAADGLDGIRSAVDRAMGLLAETMREDARYPVERERNLRIALGTGKTEAAAEAVREFLRELTGSGAGAEFVLQALYRLVVAVEALFAELGSPCPKPPALSAQTAAVAMERIEGWVGECAIARASAAGSQTRPDVVQRVRAYLHEHYGDPAITLQSLAAFAGVHPNYLTQTFRKQTGLSCMQYLAQLRMEKAKELLRETDLKISDVSVRVGYENPLYFSSYFKKWVGVYPSEFKEGMGAYA